MLLEVNEYTYTCIYSQPSLSAGSTSMDSTNHRSCAMFKIYSLLNQQMQNLQVRRADYRTQHPWTLVTVATNPPRISREPIPQGYREMIVHVILCLLVPGIVLSICTYESIQSLQKLSVSYHYFEYTEEHTEAQRNLANILRQEHNKVVVLIIGD